MKSEEEIRERIEKCEEKMERYVSHSPEWSRIVGKRNALEWVLRDE